MRHPRFVRFVVIMMTIFFSTYDFAPAQAEQFTQSTDGVFRVYLPMAISGSSQPPGGGAQQPVEVQEVLRLTNEYRAQHGCVPLTLAPELAAAAQTHTLDMTRMGQQISHTGTDGSTLGTRLTQAGYMFRTAAENIAAGYTTPAGVVEGWYTSAGHRKNIINCELHEIGIGYVFDGNSPWRYYWTQDFGVR